MATVSVRRRTRRQDSWTSSVNPSVLPCELVTEILRYLPNASLRQAAGVSRQFYACAWDAGRYIHHSLILENLSRFQQQLADFTALVEHALTKNLPLGLSFCTMTLPDSMNPGMDDIFPILAKSLPLLVYLSLQINNIHRVIPMLSIPMPRLRDLEIMGIDGEAPALPPDLFAGQSPLLLKLELANFPLSSSPLPAFAQVRSLRYVYDGTPPEFAFAHHFPKLSLLLLRSYAPDDSEVSQRLNLKGLALQSLAVEHAMLPAVRRDIALDTIPFLQCGQDTLDITWLEPEEDSADFSLRLVAHREDDSQLYVVVVPSHRLWRRMYDVSSWFPEDVLPLASKPGGTARLTYLRVDNVYLHAFLSCSVSLPSLKDVQVDYGSHKTARRAAVVWPPDAHEFASLFRPEHRTAPTFDRTASPYEVSCPVLEELTLFALDEKLTLPSREVAFLGRALGQLARPKGERAALALVGVRFALPAVRQLLRLVFSDVRLYAFAGRDSTEDLDDGLWDDLNGPAQKLHALNFDLGIIQRLEMAGFFVNN